MSDRRVYELLTVPASRLQAGDRITAPAWLSGDVADVHDTLGHCVAVTFDRALPWVERTAVVGPNLQVDIARKANNEAQEAKR